jgi:large subunit ribosomal protein L37Ae
MTKTKKVGPTGKFGVRYGKKVKGAYMAVEKKQRSRQKCPYCKRLTAKRTSKGVWACKFCGKKFAGGAFYLE